VQKSEAVFGLHRKFAELFAFIDGVGKKNFVRQSRSSSSEFSRRTAMFGAMSINAVGWDNSSWGGEVFLLEGNQNFLWVVPDWRKNAAELPELRPPACENWEKKRFDRDRL